MTASVTKWPPLFALPAGWDLVLASLGEFYRADRAYLFEPSPAKPGFWDNTFEWCASGITPQREE